MRIPSRRRQIALGADLLKGMSYFPKVSRGRLLTVIKCIYLPSTYLHFMQDIEDRCLLLMSSMGFVDLPSQEHWMMENIIWTKIHAYLHYVQNQG
jgi:hypothetical protein